MAEEKSKSEQRMSFGLDGDTRGMTVNNLVLDEMKSIVAAPMEGMPRGKTERMSFHISSTMRRKIEKIVYDPRTPFNTFSDYLRDGAAREERIAQVKWLTGEMSAESVLDLIISEDEELRVKMAKARELEEAVKRLGTNGSKGQAEKYVVRMQEQLAKMPDPELEKALLECPAYQKFIAKNEETNEPSDTPDS